MAPVSRYCEAGYQVKSVSPEWDGVLTTLAAEIKVRHYSRRTLKTYANWSRPFQRFLKNKPPVPGRWGITIPKRSKEPRSIPTNPSSP